MRAFYFIAFWLCFLLIWFFLRLPAQAHFADRPDLDNWAAHLQSKKGENCCSFADAQILTDVDWETKDGHYRVRIEGQWMDVPEEAVILDPNRYGPAVVWPIYYNGKPAKIRCFMPGAGT